MRVSVRVSGSVSESESRVRVGESVRVRVSESVSESESRVRVGESLSDSERERE